MKEEARLGRLVQCKCSHSCSGNEYGFQWLLPRTKSKHMLFEEILIKNTQDQDMMMKKLEKEFSCINLENKVKNKKINKRSNNNNIPVLNLNLKKRLLKEKQHNNLLVLKEFTVICSTLNTSMSIIEQLQFGNEYY